MKEYQRQTELLIINITQAKDYFEFKDQSVTNIIEILRSILIETDNHAIFQKYDIMWHIICDSLPDDILITWKGFNEWNKIMKKHLKKEICTSKKLRDDFYSRK